MAHDADHYGQGSDPRDGFVSELKGLYTAEGVVISSLINEMLLKLVMTTL